ncbi:MAG TPA: type II secretion system F family protein [Streptosporangiaceae bacterium]|nr:type II secretion system F family protein [Streptosporangiaceae bacterium]
MTAALALGAGFGLGLAAIAFGLAPARPPLTAALAALTRPPQPAPALPASEGGWAAQMGRPFAAVLAGLGLPSDRIRSDLAVLGRPPGRQLAEQAAAAITGLLLPPATTTVLALGGVSLGWQLPAAASLILGATGFLLPDLSVRAEAARRRDGFRHALSAFLDLVVISLAGGAGIEQALTSAAAVGTGPAFARLRGALEAARITRQPPWSHLAALGQQLGVGEMAELAASITLAGTEGAKVKTSLAAKAATLRAHQLAAAETQAQAATEQMSLPLVLLFAAFLLLVGFPAIVHVLTGL